MQSSNAFNQYIKIRETEDMHTHLQDVLFCFKPEDSQTGSQGGRDPAVQKQERCRKGSTFTSASPRNKSKQVFSEFGTFLPWESERLPREGNAEQKYPRNQTNLSHPPQLKPTC